MPLHSSLGNKSETPSKKKKKYDLGAMLPETTRFLTFQIAPGNNISILKPKIGAQDIVQILYSDVLADTNKLGNLVQPVL